MTPEQRRERREAHESAVYQKEKEELAYWIDELLNGAGHEDIRVRRVLEGDGRSHTLFYCPQDQSAILITADLGEGDLRKAVRHLFMPAELIKAIAENS